jgi:hypothetical protein
LPKHRLICDPKAVRFIANWVGGPICPTPDSSASHLLCCSGRSKSTLAKAAAEAYISAFNAKDTTAAKATFGEKVSLGNNKGLGQPQPMPTEKIIGALKVRTRGSNAPQEFGC